MRFQEFLKEREYLLGVSPKTLIYYHCAFNSWEKYATDGTPVTWIRGMRDAGIKPVSINTYICAMNAYWKWAGEGKRLAYLREEQRLLKAPSAEIVRSILRTKPESHSEQRALAVVSFLCDTGTRIEEALTLQRSNLNFDTLTATVVGKGNKERAVPISNELRRAIYRYVSSHDNPLVFANRSGGRLIQRNILRDLYDLEKRIGVPRFGFHSFRHFFAVSYLRNGGNLFYLSRILGHSSVKTTEVYLKSLGIEDLSAAHNQLSPLAHQ